MSDLATAATPRAAPDVDEYRRLARVWVQANLTELDGPPRAHEIDYYTPEVMGASRALQRRLFEAGYAGITYPTEYGGQGLSAQYDTAFLEAAEGYGLPDFGIVGGTTFGVCVPIMVTYGQPEFLRDFVPRVLGGEVLVCQFFSEPSSGSDLAGARTRAVRDGEQWVLNGQKTWSTYAHLADWGMCLARTDWDVPKHRGLTWFAVPCTSAGLTIRPIKQINETSEFCEDFFDDVTIPDANRIGGVNDGWSVTQTLLVLERGAGRAAADMALGGPGPLVPDLVALARRVGRLDDPVVRQKLARAHTNDFVGRALQARLAHLGRLGRLNPGTAAYHKLFLGTYNPVRGRIGVEVGGAGAMTWGSDEPAGAQTSLNYLNGRIMSIAGGTNEMQRNGIGERALGLPREPSFDTTKPYSEVVRSSKDWTGRS